MTIGGTISSYPLTWPEGRPRTPANRRQSSPFRTSFEKAVENVVRSLRGFEKDGARLTLVPIGWTGDDAERVTMRSERQ